MILPKSRLTKGTITDLLQTKLLLLIGALFFISRIAEASDTLSLKGVWGFQIDSNDVGLKEAWAKRKLSDSIMLPGSTDEKGIGNEFPIYRYSTMPIPNGYPDTADIGSFTRIHKYVGAAWYQKEISIPESWGGKNIVFTMERVLWQSRVFINGIEAGSGRDYLSTPHKYTLGRLSPGKHTITVRIDNREIYSIGAMGHSYCNHMQSIWNGIVGRIELTAENSIVPTFLRVFPYYKQQTVKLETTIENRGLQTIAASIKIVLRENKTGKIIATRNQALNIRPASAVYQSEIRLSEKPLPWDEFTPNLYAAEVSVTAKKETQHIHADFGFRDLESKGTHIKINGNVSLVRFSHEGLHSPLTGYPSTDVNYWKRAFKVYKENGLNGVRFHSCTPPEAAFQAADELGLYLQVEFFWQDGWMGHKAIFGTGKDLALDSFARREFRNALDTYGNHPSMVMVLYGNELGVDFDLCNKWLAEEKAYDPRRLYAVGAAHAVTPNDDFVEYGNKAQAFKTKTGNDWDYQSYYTSNGYVYSSPEIKRGTKPDFVHELGQQVVHPLWSEIESYKSGPFRLWNMEYYRSLAQKSGIEKDDTIFQKASGQMNRIIAKSDIEANLRSRSSAGYSLLSLVDYPGQGEAYVGWVDALYRQKSFLTAERFRQYGGYTVPLIRTPKFVWMGGETFGADVEVANYGPSGLSDMDIVWEAKREDRTTVYKGVLRSKSIPQGTLTGIGKFEMELKDPGPQGEHLILSVSIANTNFRNEWDIWVLPKRLPEIRKSSDVIVSENIQEALASLKKGKKVLLLAGKLGELTNTMYCKFKPVFWSAVWFGDDYCQTLGSVIRNTHPSLSMFPTQDVVDWQWFDVFERQGHGFDLKGLPLNYKPVIQPVNDFHFGKKLGLLFELKTKENGKLLVCGFNLQDSMEKRPAAIQLMNSLLSYINSAKFEPQQEVSDDWLLKTFADNNLPVTKPAGFEKALLYVKAGDRIPLVKGGSQWRPDIDASIADKGYSYSVICDGAYKDEGGTAWYGGKNIHIEIKVPASKLMVLKVKMHDWNKLGRTAVLNCEDNAPVVLNDYKEGKWVTFPVTRENCLDGKIILDIKKLAGPNAMISELALVPVEE